MIGVGATLNERFTLIKELGQGGMGTVYRATDHLLGRDVAIKLLKESGGEEISNKIHIEAQILARLVHDKIVRLYDFAQAEGVYFLVMEEVNGPSLSHRWRHLPPYHRLRICGQVAEALDYAHAQGVIHRDVKPGNVLMTSNDDPKLSDFGLSLIVDDKKDVSGTIRGTPHYMSPEQAQGKALDHRTDLYAVGVMLYECATGEVPFVGSVMSVMHQHVNIAPASPRFMNPEISPALESLILSLLDKNPKKRPLSGNLVASALVEESEHWRARWQQQITPDLNRLDPLSSLDSPVPSRTVITVSDPKDIPARPNIDDPGVSDVIRSSSISAPSQDSLNSSGIGQKTSPESIAREMLAETLSTPIVVSPHERYLCGHYLAYLLGGSRRTGIFLRRPLDEKNANRARLLLAMTWLSQVDATPEAIKRASSLLEERPDVRAVLSPVVVVKYLASRSTPDRRKKFRQIRKQLQVASTYARQSMLDRKGILNPGMMPRTLEDLETIAPPRDSLDANRVSLWNRLAEVWRQDDDFRHAVLRYAIRSSQPDPSSADLWPEVVYPLIERTHWQRTFRPRHEALWDYVVGKILRIPVAGVKLDRMMISAVPADVAQQFDDDIFAFVDDPQLDHDDEANLSESREIEERPVYFGAEVPREAPPNDDEPRFKVRVPLAQPDPFLFTSDNLRDLWNEAMDAQENSARPVTVHRTIPVGPYRLAVIPTARGRSAVRAALQGLHQGKQIEILTPPIVAKGSGAKPVIAVWLYKDGSMAVVHLDFQSKERYILWHAPNAHQYNLDYLEGMNTILSSTNMELPERLDRRLSK